VAAFGTGDSVTILFHFDRDNLREVVDGRGSVLVKNGKPVACRIKRDPRGTVRNFVCGEA